MSTRMSLVLQYRLANQAWQQIPLLEGDLLIGRGSGSSLRLTGRGVSRRHAEIRRRGDQLWIADLGSTNGTLLNGQRLKRDTPQALHAGQTIRIGDYSLAVVASPHAAPVPTPMARPASGHIFISYSRHDTQLVYPLVDKLEKLGFRVWIDKQDIKPGRPWRGQIVQAIAEADALVLMVSPNSVASTNVQKEIDLASDDKIMILPVILQPAKYPDGLKFQLIDLQYIDLFSNPEHGYSQLVQALRERQRILAQQPPRVRPRDIRAELLLPGARVSDFYREKQEQLLKFLAQTTNISPRELSIVELTAGSVRVVVNMPATAAYELKAQALNGNPALLAAGIASLRLAGDKAFIAIGGGPPPAAGTAGQAPGGPPAAPAAGGLKSMLWVAGAFAATIAVIVGVYALTNGERPAVVPPPITVTHTPTFTRPPLTRTPTATRTRTPTPTITRTRTPTPTRPSLTPTIPSRTPDIQVGIPEPIGPSGWELFVCSASSTTISLVWTEVFDPSQPVTYEWELSRYTGSGYAIYDSGITRETSVDVTVECFEDDYSWRVRAIDGAGNEGVFSPYANFSANEDYSVDIPQTYAPYNWETITCNDITADVTFEWQEVEDISQPVWYQWETYQHDIQCPVDEGECWDVYYYLDNGTTGDTTATVEFSCFPEELAWRVQAIDGLENQSAFSAYTHFEVQPFVAVPQPISPVDTSISCYYSTISITLTWSGIFDPNEPVLYEWQLEFYDSYYGYSYYDAGSTYNTSATLSVSCGLDFRWRVRAQDSLGNTSEYSNSVEFSVVHTVD